MIFDILLGVGVTLLLLTWLGFDLQWFKRRLKK